MMKRTMYGVLAVAVVCSISSMAMAGPGCCKSKDAAATTVAMKDGCCATAGFPTMAMKVGDKSYNCPMEAGKAAEKAHGKIMYVVAGESFGCKESAQVALAKASEEYVSKFTTIACVVDGKLVYCDEKDAASCKSNADAKTCSKSGSAVTRVSVASTATRGEPGTCDKSKDAMVNKSSGKTTTVAAASGASTCSKNKSTKFMVAGQTFDSMEKAVKAREQILAAIKPVSMKYIVDGKEVSCSSQVCPKAKADGKVTFVVNNEKANCEEAARVSLAKAQYETAKTTAEKVSKS